MYVFIHRFTLLFFTVFFTSQAVVAQSKRYPDGHGGQVSFPQGDKSFADEVIESNTGSQQPTEDARDPEQALGVPNYKEGNQRGYVSLGCGGELVLKFTDNQLIDIAGPDLYVFEVGPAIEPTALAVSNDNQQWIGIGQISGGKSEIDIAPYVDKNTSFRYVKLIDLQQKCGGKTPGADIDAVGAIGSLQHIALDSSVLFNTGQYQLKAEASRAINDALKGIDSTQLQSVTIGGHTDNVGSIESNQMLSKNRAQSVANYLVEHTNIDTNKIMIQAYGESRPIASNETAEGRQKNRRVSLSIRSIAAENNVEVDRIEVIGIWRSADNRQISLTNMNGSIKGEYTKNGGRIEGKLSSDTVIDGHWIKDQSSQSCETVKDGSKHWGKLRIQFDSSDRSVLDAKWSYCDNEKWQGNWQQAKRIL